MNTNDDTDVLRILERIKDSLVEEAHNLHSSADGRPGEEQQLVRIALRERAITLMKIASSIGSAIVDELGDKLDEARKARLKNFSDGSTRH